MAGPMRGRACAAADDDDDEDEGAAAAADEDEDDEDDEGARSAAEGREGPKEFCTRQIVQWGKKIRIIAINFK